MFASLRKLLTGWGQTAAQPVGGNSEAMAVAGSLGGVWAMAPRALQDLAAQIASMSWPEIQSRAAAAETPAGPGYERRGPIAIVNVAGPLFRSDSALARAVGGSDYVTIARAVKLAADDPTVSAIVLRVSSPGGTAAGLEDAAETLRLAAMKKPLIAHTSDAAGSAAFRLAVIAREFYASPGAYVGSVGAIIFATDLSQALERAGVRVHTFASGPRKGAGLSPIVTPEHEAELQKMVDDVAATFVRAVAQGRGMTEAAVRQLAHGGVWQSAEAHSLGLLDGVTQFDALIGELTNRYAKQTAPAGMPVNAVRPCSVPSAGAASIAAPPAAEIPATPPAMTDGQWARETRALCPYITADFMIAQREAGATPRQAHDAAVRDPDRAIDKAAFERARAARMPKEMSARITEAERDRQTAREFTAALRAAEMEAQALEAKAAEMRAAATAAPVQAEVVTVRRVPAGRYKGR